MSGSNRYGSGGLRVSEVCVVVFAPGVVGLALVGLALVAVLVPAPWVLPDGVLEPANPGS